MSRRSTAAPLDGVSTAPSRTSRLCVGLLAGVLVLATTSLLGSEGLASPRCTPGWRLVPSARVPSQGASLNGVEILAGNDVWAVGSLEAPPYGALIEHWNGRAWTVVPSPKISYSGLSAIAAVSGRNIWAVGGVDTAALVEHWDGKSWRTTKIDPLVQDTARLGDVTAITEADVWAVGKTGQTPQKPFAAHWNGRGWKTLVPFPALPGHLDAVAASSGHSVWAVGGSLQRGLAVRWDGREWKATRVPRTGYAEWLSGLAVSSSRDVWAVSWGGALLHWDGGRWLEVAHWTHPGNPDITQLNAVAASAADDLWAVGYEAILHWDGRALRSVPAPRRVEFTAVSLGSRDSGWAVGFRWDGATHVPITAQLSCSN